VNDVIEGLTAGSIVVAVLGVALLIGRSVGPSVAEVEAQVEVADTRVAVQALTAALVEVRIELARGNSQRDSTMAAMGFFREIEQFEDRWPWLQVAAETRTDTRGATQ
jgi:hypothetical protein